MAPLAPLCIRHWCDLTLARFVFGKNFRVVIHSSNEWLNNEVPLHDDIVCFTDGSKVGKTSSTGASIFISTKGKDFVLPMAYTTTVFQAEVYAILMCALELQQEVNQSICICSDSQGALKEINANKITPRFVSGCQDIATLRAMNEQIGLLSKQPKLTLQDLNQW